MTVLAIFGSPRRGGNTSVMLGRCLEGAMSAGASIEKLFLSELNISPCRGCRACDKTGICVIQDEMRVVLDGIRRANSVVISSPIYFGSVSAQVKIMIDRLQPVWVMKYRNKRPLYLKEEGRTGLFLCAGGMKNSEFYKAAESVVRSAFAVLNVEFRGSVFSVQSDEKGDIYNDVKALDAAFEAGRDLVVAQPNPQPNPQPDRPVT